MAVDRDRLGLTPPTWRRRAALTARVAGVALVVLATTGKLPHLVLTQAVVSALLSLVVAPLWLLDPGSGRWLAWTRRVTPYLAVFLVAAGTIGIQLPGVVGLVSEGGPLTALALAGLLAGAIAFWAMVMPPNPPVSGIAAAGYVIIGGVPISMPATFLMLVPADIYHAFHAGATSPLDGRTDQLLAGFVLFAAVKIVILTVASVLFFAAAAREVAEREDDDDDRDRAPVEPPVVPGWVRQLGVARELAEEPVFVRATFVATPIVVSEPERLPRVPVGHEIES